MRKLFIFFIAFIIASTCFALPLERKFRDLKLVTQQLIEKQSWTAPIAADEDYLSANIAGPTTAATTTVAWTATQPDFARNITITPTGTTTDVENGTITVTGKDIFGGIITEDFTLTANGTSTLTGDYAFKSITSLTFTASAESGTFSATYNVGVGEKLGLKRCMDYAGHGMFSTHTGVYETTRSTFVADADEIEKNTVDLNTALDGSGLIEVFFIQNFACFP